MERQRSQDFSAVQPQDDGGAQLEESDDSDDGHDHDHDQEDHEEDTGAADACADGHCALDCAHVREDAGRQAGRRRGTLQTFDGAAEAEMQSAVSVVFDVGEADSEPESARS